MTSKLFIEKTGMEMFDVSRAYGITLAYQYQLPEPHGSNVELTDLHSIYMLSYTGKPKNDFSSPKWLSLFAFKEEGGLRQAWTSLFKTFGAKRELSELIDTVKYGVQSNFPPKNNFLRAKPAIKKEDGFITIPQSLDVSAAKGFRTEKRGAKYTEGDQLFSDIPNWALACLGAVHFCKWLRADRQGGRYKYTLSVQPNPLEISVLNHREIQKDMNEGRLCELSAICAITHYAVKLQISLLKRTADKSKYFRCRYSHLIFNIMQATGQQSKPSGGGEFPLELLHNIGSEDDGQEALQMMNEVLSNGWRGGVYQDMAFSLADFLSKPTTPSLRRYVHTHLAAFLNKKYRNLYSESSLGAVMKYVQNV